MSYFIFKKAVRKLIFQKLKQLQRNDCLAFDAEKISLEKYFKRKFFVKNSREVNHLKLLSLIPNFYLNEPAFNKDDDKFKSKKNKFFNFIK